MVYFNKKAQSLTELATFGSILLLVLSFLISYGMRYNYQQDMQMRAFRTALSEAYTNANNRPDATASITLIEDKHVPDPRDMFGAGNIVPVQAGAEVTWGNTLREEIKSNADLPRIKYVINNQPKEYTTAGLFLNVSPTTFPGGVYVELPGIQGKVKKDWSDLIIYQPDADLPKQVGVKISETDKELISEVFLHWDWNYDGVVDALDINSGPTMKIIKVLPEDGKDGDQVTGLEVVNSAGGQIDLRYTQLNKDINGDGIPDVTPGNVQGLLLDAEQDIRRSGKLTITETPGTSESSSTYSFKDKDGNPTTITHKIRDKSGVAAPIISPFERSRGLEWKITK